MERTACVQLARGVVCGGVVLGALALAAVWQFGSLRNLSLYLNGIDYVVEPTRVDVGSGTSGEKRTAAIHIRNLSFKPIQVVGLKVTCSCVSSESLPFDVEPREIRDFELVVSIGGASTDFERVAVLFFDNHGKMRQVPIRITGRCIDVQEEHTESETAG